MPGNAPDTIETVLERLAEQRYIGDRPLATAIFLALRLGKPLFIEGEAGVGKTEAAKVMADVLGARLIRLQCYEGIDAAHAVYEWNYPRQLLHIRLLNDSEDRQAAEKEIFSREFLLRRPLLDAIDNDDEVPPVLLIDEIDRSDEEFEAFLLELLSDFQISIPELGTIRARQQPFVVITSNRPSDARSWRRRRPDPDDRNPGPAAPAGGLRPPPARRRPGRRPRTPDDGHPGPGRDRDPGRRRLPRLPASLLCEQA